VAKEGKNFRECTGPQGDMKYVPRPKKEKKKKKQMARKEGEKGERKWKQLIW